MLTRCDCYACSSGAGVCSRKMTDDQMLDAYGFDRRGRVRTVGKGRELHGRLPPALDLEGPAPRPR